MQNFTGGTFMLRDAANAELLSGTLGGSSIAGPIGGTGTGGLFTTTFSTRQSDRPVGTNTSKTNSLTLSMSFTDVKSNGVERVSHCSRDPTATRTAFTGDVTINIGADQRFQSRCVLHHCCWSPRSVAGAVSSPPSSCDRALEPIERVDPAGQLLAFCGREIAVGDRRS